MTESFRSISKMEIDEETDCSRKERERRGRFETRIRKMESELELDFNCIQDQIQSEEDARSSHDDSSTTIADFRSPRLQLPHCPFLPLPRRT